MEAKEALEQLRRAAHIIASLLKTEMFFFPTQKLTESIFCKFPKEMIKNCKIRVEQSEKDEETDTHLDIKAIINNEKVYVSAMLTAYHDVLESFPRKEVEWALETIRKLIEEGYIEDRIETMERVYDMETLERIFQRRKRY